MAMLWSPKAHSIEVPQEMRAAWAVQRQSEEQTRRAQTAALAVH
jgi:hypothetical protein